MITQSDELLATKAELHTLRRQLLHARLVATASQEATPAPRAPPSTSAPPARRQPSAQPTTNPSTAAQPCYLCHFLSLFAFANIISFTARGLGGGCGGSPLASVASCVLFFFFASHILGFAVSIFSGLLFLLGSALLCMGSMLVFLLQSGLVLLFLPFLPLLVSAFSVSSSQPQPTTPPSFSSSRSAHAHPAAWHLIASLKASPCLEQGSPKVLQALKLLPFKAP